MDFLQWLLSSGTSLVAQVVGAIEGFFSACGAWVPQAMAWLQAMLVSGATAVASPGITMEEHVVAWIWSTLPPIVQGALSDFWSGPGFVVVKQVITVIWYLASFIVPPQLLLACVECVMVTWFTAVVLKFVIWLLRWIPSMGGPR